MKLKTMYCGALYNAEISYKDMRDLLRKTDPGEWEHELRCYAIAECCDPQYYEESEDEDKADNSFNEHFKVYDYQAYSGGLYFEISCTVLEKYRVDEDGDYYDGGNYDWHDAMSEETRAMLEDIVD